MDRFVGNGAGDALVDHIDHAADRRRSVEERFGTAEHFDSFRQQRIDHDCMVDAGI